MNGERCPTHEHAPRTDAGAIAWALAARGSGQWRQGMAGPTGLDVTGLLGRPLASGADAATLEWLLLEIEAGALAGFKKLKDGQGGGSDV